MQSFIQVDGGDYNGGGGSFYQLKAEYLLRGMVQLQYDAINLGEKDLYFGDEFILEMKKKYKVPFVSANLIYQDSKKPLVEPYIIKKIKVGKHEYKVGIFGIISAGENLVTYIENRPKLIATDPFEAAKKVVEELNKEKCTVIVALAHIGFSSGKELARLVPGIDLIITGHGYSVRTSPLIIDSSCIVQGKNRGQTLNILTLQFDKENKIESQVGREIELDDNYNDDPSFINLMTEFKEAQRKSLQEMQQNTSTE